MLRYQRLDQLPALHSAATHDGTFHLDDVLSASVITRLYPHVPIVRTRDAAILDKSDLVFDVGGVCDLKKLRLDHHLRAGPPRRSNGVPFAALGLTWLVFGEFYCQAVSARCGVEAFDVVRQVEEQFILPIDARDNGELNITATAGSSEFETMTYGSLAELVQLNRPIAILDEPASATMLQKRFLWLAKLFQHCVLDRWVRAAIAALKTPRYVVSCFDDGPILVLDRACAWAMSVERLLPDVRIVVSLVDGETDRWCVKPVKRKGKLAASFPEEWHGKNGEELTRLTSIAAAATCLHDGRALFVVGRESATSYAEFVLYPKQRKALTEKRTRLLPFHVAFDHIVSEQKEREAPQRRRSGKKHG